MEEKEKNDIDFDFEFEVIPPKVGDPKYDIRKILKYCEENNKSTEEITSEELEQFINGYITEEELLEEY
nr:MAG TPA: integrase [Caudoviricetes sp.]